MNLNNINNKKKKKKKKSLKKRNHNNNNNNNNNILKKLGDLTFSTLRLCKFIAKLIINRTLALFPSPSSMDDDDFSLFDDHQHLLLPPLPPQNNNNNNKLYLVPYRWYKDAQNNDNAIAASSGGGLLLGEGVLYNVLSKGDNDSEIFFNLRKHETFVSSLPAAEQGLPGREYALLTQSAWFQALKWHNNSTMATEEEEEEDTHNNLYAQGPHSSDLFPLQVHFSVNWETNLLTVKISLKDNMPDLYQRACSIFSSKSDLSYIWDFSEQIAQCFAKDLADNSLGQLNEGVLLELQIYGFSDLVEGTDKKNDESMRQSESGSSEIKEGGARLAPTNNSQLGSRFRIVGNLGLRGLQNLGNTCFMNSAIQCLAHTPELVTYFMGNYQKEINYTNPLGMNGEIAFAFGDLLRKLWAPGTTPVAPRIFKLKLAKFAHQFSGYNQQDSQELLSFLLDGLHEDLNRVKSKPYIEIKDEEGRPDEDAAEEYWRNHLARNDSVIVDLFHGQYQSKLVCPVCKKVSITFDPLLFLSVPLPSTTMRTMTVTMVSPDGETLPSPCTVTVPKWGKFQDLVDALTVECSIRNDETLLVAEIYKNSIFQYFEEPSDSLALIRDADKLVAYRLPKSGEKYPLVVFTHERDERVSSFGSGKGFGFPLVARLSNASMGSDIRGLYLKLLNPFLMPVEDAVNGFHDAKDSTVWSKVSDSDSETDNRTYEHADFQFYIIEDKKVEKEIKMNEPVQISSPSNILEVCVSWSEDMIEKYDTCLLSTLAEVLKPHFFTKKPQESVSLYKCLEAFLKEEPLGPENMWYCPSCKTPRQASKRLDLWRLPEVLVVHLKRFSYSRTITNKLETFVDFPIDGFDLSSYITHRSTQSSAHYKLYAISNHYGGMGSGHYTAFVDVGNGRWYEFDDESVFPVSVDRVKTGAAYVLFYRRIPDN